MEEFEAIITGRVQMVMFRDFTRRKARSLGLLGTVENMSDGTVRVVAQGERKVLEALLAYLKKGPSLANVTDVSISWREPSSAFSSFDIVYHSLLDRL